MSRSSPELPTFIPPMLAKSARPFDSEAHLFELKWDGFRALSFIEQDSYRVLSRRQTDFTGRYPELGFLAQLPAGTSVDGELVLLRDGKPDFEGMLRRARVGGDLQVQAAAAGDPVAYVVFDLLYDGFQSVMTEPLYARRERLQALLAPIAHPGLIFSEGIVGAGRSFFESAKALGLEGMVAKALDSRYESGERTGAWVKIKESKVALCAVLGWLPDDAGDVRSLVIAMNDEDGLTPVGKVGSGMTEAMREQLRGALEARPAAEPLVPCEEPARWVSPGLYCKVRFLERTSRGTLRGPVFLELIVDDAP